VPPIARDALYQHAATSLRDPCGRGKENSPIEFREATIRRRNTGLRAIDVLDERRTVFNFAKPRRRQSEGTLFFATDIKLSILHCRPRWRGITVRVHFESVSQASKRRWSVSGTTSTRRADRSR